MKRILIIEREYGCGAGEIAQKAAQRLGWSLLDRELRAEIARLANVDPAESARHEERLDSWLYRLGKIFWRGSYEQALPVDGPEILDADRMLELVREVVTEAAEAGQCVIVGRGAPYFLRNRSDTFSAHSYSWRWLFYINIPVGIAAMLMIQRFIEDPPYLRHARPAKIDAFGFGLLAIGLATLQVVLDKGQEADWFGAVWVRWTTLISAVALIWFVVWELRVHDPMSTTSDGWRWYPCCAWSVYFSYARRRHMDRC